MHYVYIVECSDGTFYTGYTTDIKRRLKAHNEGKGAKYTKIRKPVQLIYKEVFESKRSALQREYRIKQLTRAQKEKLIQTKGG